MVGTCCETRSLYNLSKKSTFAVLTNIKRNSTIIVIMINLCMFILSILCPVGRKVLTSGASINVTHLCGRKTQLKLPEIEE